MHRAETGGLSAVTHFLQQAISGAAEKEYVDVRVIDINIKVLDNVKVLSCNRIEDLLRCCHIEHIRASCASPRIFVVNQLSASVMEVLGNAFECDVGFFNDHIQQSGDEVDFVLPSKLNQQRHQVIPYMRRYTRRTKKDRPIEGRNLRSSFSHGYLATTEEHVTILSTWPRTDAERKDQCKISKCMLPSANATFSCI